MKMNEIENKLLDLGYKYNFNKTYMFKTIFKPESKKISATSFYIFKLQAFECEGDRELIKQLKTEAKHFNVV